MNLRAVTTTAALLASAACSQLALQPTGTSSHVLVADTPDLVPPAGITVEAWILPQLGGSSSGVLVAKETGTSNPNLPGAWKLFFNNSVGFQAKLSPGGGQVGVVAPGMAFPPVWRHVAATFDNFTAKLYLDGVQVGTAGGLGPIDPIPGDLRIGGGLGAGSTWTGLIDEVRIWAYPRTNAQILAAKDSLVESVPGLVACWRFDGNYLDLTGLHHGSPVGTNAFAANFPILVASLSGPAVVMPGATIVYALSAPASLVPYVLDVSVAGTGPGLSLGPGGPFIPVNPPYLFQESGGLMPGVFSGFIGTLNATGHATAHLSVPAVAWLGFYDISASFITLSPYAPFNVGYVASSVTTVLDGPLAQVQSVSPPAGPTAGGTALTITGANFHAASTVRIGGKIAHSVAIRDATTIVCVAPSGPVGPAQVEVFDPTGEVATLPAGYVWQ